MKKGVLFFIIAIMLILSGCTNAPKSSVDGNEQNKMFSYKRKTEAITLPKNINPFRIDYEEDGLFCYELKQSLGEEDASSDEFVFYYQEYNDSESKEILKADKFVNGFIGNTDADPALSLLFADEKITIEEYAISGMKKELITNEVEDKLYGLANLYKLPSNEYAITLQNRIYIVSDKKEKSITIEDTISKLINVGDETFAFTFAPNGNKKSLLRVDTRNQRTEKAFEIDDAIINVFSLTEKLALVYQDKVVLVDTNGESKEELINLNKEVIFATKIAYIGGNKEAFKIVIDDVTDTEQILCIYMTKKTEEDMQELAGAKKEEGKNHAGGEKVTVKMVVPKDYYYDIEFHAKKFNQKSDYAFVEIERLEESLEDYLGKGERPDIVMFDDNTDVSDYVKKNILTDLSPCIEGYGKISLDDIVPVVREMVSDIGKDKIYALATNFRLLLMTSDGTEKKNGENISIVNYLKWYDRYLTDKELKGTGNIQNFLYANLPDFYDEKTAETKFNSNEFKELMHSYKEIRDKHPEKLDVLSLGDTYDRAVRNILNAPFWYDNYGSNQLAFAGYSFEGIPTTSGQRKIYASVEYPMGILESSNCKEEAYEFIEYYIMLNDYLIKGYAENMYGDNELTKTRLSILQSYIDKYIFNTSKPYLNVLWRLTMEKETLYYTEENLANLRRLLVDTTPVTKAQEDIYEIMLEDMEPYFTGNKNLDSACDALDSRARLYLMERK